MKGSNSSVLVLGPQGRGFPARALDLGRLGAFSIFLLFVGSAGGFYSLVYKAGLAQHFLEQYFIAHSGRCCWLACACNFLPAWSCRIGA